MATPNTAPTIRKPRTPDTRTPGRPTPPTPTLALADDASDDSPEDSASATETGEADNVDAGQLPGDASDSEADSADASPEDSEADSTASDDAAHTEPAPEVEPAPVLTLAQRLAADRAERQRQLDEEIKAAEEAAIAAAVNEAVPAKLYAIAAHRAEETSTALTFADDRVSLTVADLVKLIAPNVDVLAEVRRDLGLDATVVAAPAAKPGRKPAKLSPVRVDVGAAPAAGSVFETQKAATLAAIAGMSKGQATVEAIAGARRLPLTADKRNASLANVKQTLNGRGKQVGLIAEGKVKEHGAIGRAIVYVTTGK